jgi:hypothetical protein
LISPDKHCSRTNARQKKKKAERQKKYIRVFMNGKQGRVKRPETIEGMDKDEFIIMETQSGPVTNELASDKSGLALSIPIVNTITGTNTVRYFLFNP